MTAAPLPEPVMPMLATAGPVPHGPGWAFEFKWDGVRAIVAASGTTARLTSRLGNDVTAGYPELAGIGALTGGRPVLLDGEIVALDAAGRPNFGLLQDRMHVRHPSPELRGRIPVSFYAFDLLQLDGESLLAAPYDERRSRLAELGPVGPVLVPPSFTDVDGDQLLEVARGHGLEGVVAKRRAGRYEVGRRSAGWVKTALSRTQEVLVGGWTVGEGRRSAHVRVAAAGRPRRRRPPALPRARRHGVPRHGARRPDGPPAPAGAARPARSTRRCRASTPATRGGSSRCWSGRSSTA